MNLTALGAVMFCMAVTVRRSEVGWVVVVVIVVDVMNNFCATWLIAEVAEMGSCRIGFEVNAAMGLDLPVDPSHGVPSPVHENCTGSKA